MIFKIIAFIAAAIPIVLFVRAMFFRRPTKVSEGFQEFKKQANLAVTIFLYLIAIIVAVALGKLIWTWWAPL
jgi:NADH:ubiquinone oxidoreductase subunit 6 (subunit J)